MTKKSDSGLVNSFARAIASRICAGVLYSINLSWSRMPSAGDTSAAAVPASTSACVGMAVVYHSAPVATASA